MTTSVLCHVNSFRVVCHVVVSAFRHWHEDLYDPFFLEAVSSFATGPSFGLDLCVRRHETEIIELVSCDETLAGCPLKQTWLYMTRCVCMCVCVCVCGCVCVACVCLCVIAGTLVETLTPNPHQMHPRIRTPRSQRTKNRYHTCERQSKWAVSSCFHTNSSICDCDCKWVSTPFTCGMS